MHCSMSGVAKGVADDFRDRGREASLFRGVEFEQAGDLRGALSRGDDILIVVEIQR